jgi:hypothetical protein
MTGNRYASSALAAALLLLAGLACYDGPHREPQEYYIPKGYVGWVRVEYGVKGAPELPSKWFEPHQQYWFPESGLLRTSSQLYQGAASAHHFYYHGKEVTPLPENMEHGGVISWIVNKPDGSPIGMDFVTFFVGSEEQYNQHKDELERYKVGDLKYVMNNVADLPRVGNLAASNSAGTPR